VRSLKRLGDHILSHWDHEDGRTWTFKYMKASQGIALAGESLHRAAARTHAATVIRENSQKDSRRQLAHIGPLQADVARRMVAKKAELSLEEEEAKVEARRIKANKKAEKEEEALAIVHRKAVKAANKALGIKTPRYYKPRS